MAAEPMHNIQTKCRTCTSASIKPQPIVGTSPQYHNPYATVELTGRVNVANIFAGDIWVTALSDTGEQISTITRTSVISMGTTYTP